MFKLKLPAKLLVKLYHQLYLRWNCVFALTEVGEAFTLEEQDEKEQLLEEVGRD